MLLQVGELAKRSGITVRTLHYYHSIGLLTPSARSEAGYRLYNHHDVRRLQQIQALRRLGVALAEINTLLSGNPDSLPDVIFQQISALDRQLAHITALRERLVHLHGQLRKGDEPATGEWLTTLEMMTMYDNYFSAEELTQLPLYQADPAREAEWQGMVAEATQLMQQGVTAQQPVAQQLARRWMLALQRDTANNPAFVARLNMMHDEQPTMRQQSGITPEILDFITRAFAETKLQIYQKYLSDTEYAYVREHYFDRLMEWPPLIARYREALEQGVAADSLQASALAENWLELFRSYASDNPATQQKIRQAMEREPTLLEGTWLTPALLTYLRQTLAHLLSPSARKGASEMKPEIVELPARTIAGYRLTGPWQDTAPVGFARLSQWTRENNIHTGDWLAVYYDNPDVVAEEALRIDTSISVPDDFVLPENSEGVAIRPLPGGTFAVVRVQVSDGDFARPWLAFFRWLESSGYRKADAPCFDRYLNDGSASGVWDFEICVPVIKS